MLQPETIARDLFCICNTYHIYRKRIIKNIRQVVQLQRRVR